MNKDEAMKMAKRLKGHECDFDEIDWKKDYVYGWTGGHHFGGSCPECGKKYESVYNFFGIWDVEKEDWARLAP